MSTFIHELPGWPAFTWDHARVALALATARHIQGRLHGRMEALGFPRQADAVLRTLTADVVKSSDIWCLGCLTRAIEAAQGTLTGVMDKPRTWETLRDVPLNDRQRLVINTLLDGFEGKLTTSKWATLTKASHDTALRDIRQLVERGVLVQNPGGGRSTSYALAPA